MRYPPPRTVSAWPTPADAADNPSDRPGGDAGGSHDDWVRRGAFTLSSPLAAIVATAPASTRLRNVISRSARDDSLPARTAADYLQLGVEAPDIFCRALWGFGHHLACELDVLVAAVAAGTALIWPQVVSREQPCPQSPSSRPATLIDALTYTDVLRDFPVSPRTSNTLLRAGIGSRPVRNFIIDAVEERRVLERIPDFGTGALAELEASIERALEYHTAYAALCDDPPAA